MAYSFEQLLAADPSNPANIAQNASIVIFAPGDATQTPLAITDTTGSPLPNPIQVNANGFGPAFMHATLDRVAWAGGGFTAFMTSYEGMKAEAIDARAAAQEAAATAGAEAAAVATAAIAGATEEATAAAESAATAASNASASAIAAANAAALVGAPADNAIAAAVTGSATATKAALNATYGDLVTASKSIPAALGWGATPAITPKLTNLRGGQVIGDVGVTAKALFATYSQAQANPVNRYYAAPTGNDSNAGTYAAPWRTIKKCIEAANAAGGTARIMVTAGNYFNGDGFEGVSPTVDTAFVASGGPVIVSNGMATSAYTFAPHATYTRTYYINPTPAGGVSRVLDLTRVDEFGNYRELTKVASDTLCNETPGSYYEGSALYIRRADGAAVTAANTRVLLTKNNFVLTSEKNVYVGTEDGSPWVIEGSANSASGTDPGAVMAYVLAPTNAASKAFVMENVRVDFAGEPTAGANSFTIDRWNGVAAFFNCQGNAPTKDAFNGHNIGNLATKMLFLTVNCSATDVGRGIQSCNGLTIHENVIGIDVAGRYTRGRGGTVHNINNSKHYLLGTHVNGDLGDLNIGGGIHPTAILTNNSAEIWAERVTIDMPPGTFAYRTVLATSKIHRRECEPTRQPDSGPGVFDTF